MHAKRKYLRHAFAHDDDDDELLFMADEAPLNRGEMIRDTEGCLLQVQQGERALMGGRIKGVLCLSQRLKHCHRRYLFYIDGLLL